MDTNDDLTSAERLILRLLGRDLTLCEIALDVAGRRVGSRVRR